jgi:hypothetical protein
MRYFTGRKKEIYFFILALFFMLIVPSNILAQWQNYGGIKTNILSSTSQSTKIEYLLINYNERTVDVNGTECVYYQVPGSISLMEKGMPELPTDRRSIVIPDLAATVYSILDAEYEIIETLPVMPSKFHLNLMNSILQLIGIQQKIFYWMNHTLSEI